MAMTSFKSDESFLQKLAVGAAGTRATINRLKELGFSPVELERGSTGFKIWKTIKIKRIRVPDILCLRTGKRFESRGKTKLEISMSHSLKDPGRAWDACMRPDDWVAVLLCAQASDSPVDWVAASPVHFIKISDMQKAVQAKVVQLTKPKGVEEGSEIRMIWPSSTAKEESIVEDLNEKSILLRVISNNKSQRIVLRRRNCNLSPQCKRGDEVDKNQIAASCVPIDLSPACDQDVDEGFFREKLASASLSERYAAAKALRFRGFKESAGAIKERMSDSDEDIYVKLEAAAAFAAHGNDDGWKFLTDSLASQYLTVQLETVIVLSELQHETSQKLLIDVLTEASKNNEVRAGAAWALGEFKTLEAALALMNTFDLASSEIKIEAARALLKISPLQIECVKEQFKQVEPQKRDGIAWALSRVGGYRISELLSATSDVNARQWVSYIAGYGRNNFSEGQISELCDQDPEVYFAASVLWQLFNSWINGLEVY